MAINTPAEALEAGKTLAARLREFGSVISLIERSAARTPDATALTYLDSARDYEVHTRWTYAQFLARIRGAGALFAELSAGKPVVSIVLPSIPENHVALWGAQVTGVANPLNPWLESEHLVQLMKAAGTTVMVTSTDESGSGVSKKAIAAALSVPTLRAICLVGQAPRERSGIPDHIEVIEFDTDKLAEAPRSQQLDEPTGSQPAAYFHTGGTTSAPKLAMLSHENLIAAAIASNLHLGLSAEDVALGGLPLFHINGVSVTALWPWAAGAEVVMLGAMGFREPKLFPRFWELARKHRGTYLSGVPTVYQALVNGTADAGNESRQTRIKFGVVGAAPLPRELRTLFESTCNIPLIEGYGLTESACVATVGPRHGPVPAASVGMALAGLQVRAVEIDQENRRILNDVPSGSVGTIVLKGSNIFLGYLEEAHDRRAWVHDDSGRWFDTGDLGSVDKQGFWRLAGRAKDLIIRGGHNIDPALIESGLSRHPAVALVAAVGRPDAKLGELPAAYVQLHPGAQATQKELLAFAEKSIPERAAVPRHIEIVDSLPLTAVGKIYKPALVCRQIEQVINEHVARSDYRGRHAASARLDATAGYVASVELLDRAAPATIEALRKQLEMFSFNILLK